jgi:raffinose/stachyose/melibiose transport system substrate-binding protein
MRKKLFLSLTAAAVIAAMTCSIALFTGCSSQSSNESSTATESGEHEAITIMNAQRDYSAFIDLVHEKYPEINIEVVPYRGRNMSAYCKQQLETGIMPDIYSTTQAWDESIQAENLLDLSSYSVTELYNSARLEEYSVDGSVYLLPFDYSVSGILCNKSLLERAGLEIPTSLEQLVNETIPALEAQGISVSECLLDLPGSAFQYFFNGSSPETMNTASGREWRASFIDTESDTWATGSEKMQESVDYFQRLIDCGLIKNNANSSDYSAVLNTFMEGNTAFLVGTVKRFTQNEDGTGDQYVLMPWLSEDGSNNTYITSPSRFYGINKELAESGNEQKLEDALHVLEVLSTYEGYLAINGEESTNMCSINDFKVSEDSPYYEAVQQVNTGHSMNMIYTGWDNYLVTFGEAVLNWIKGEGTADEALAALDDTKRSIRENGVTYYATATEELDTIQAAKLSGQMFMEATGADAALISYNVYSPEVNALMENSYGANGSILPGKMTEEYITIFLPTGWYDTLLTLERTGKEIKEMAEAGADTRGTGFYYPYVLQTATGQDLADDETYTVVVCGYNKAEKDTLGLTDTGIVGLDAAKTYLQEVETVSSKTIDESLVKYVGTVE